MAWDILIKNATVFDGTGAHPQQQDLAISDGVIVARENQLEGDANEVIDAAGQWLMPGLLDIHTHYDLEVELEPGLPESVRHGTTTVVMSNCSLGVAFGNQKTERQNPVVDCFARVENIPKAVLHDAVEAMTWNNTGEYLDHFEGMNLGPNVVPMIPHSMLRIEVMGLEDAISREPTEGELQQMEALLDQAMHEGYTGFSTDGLPLHFLAEDPHRNVKIPTQHASYDELKRLTHVVRRHQRVWQTTPDPESKWNTVKTFSLTSGKLHGKPLRTTATAAIDLDSNKGAAKGLRKLSRLFNSSLLDGHFRFQALSAPFRVYAEGVTTPLMEEKPSFRELIALEVDDQKGRMQLLNDRAFTQRFKNDWHSGKKGLNLARLQRKLSIEPTTFSRNLCDMDMDTCPVASWHNMNLQRLYERFLAFQNNSYQPQDDEEKAVLENAPRPIGDDADFILYLLRTFDRAFRWSVSTANNTPSVLKELVFDEETLPGFNDSGAHLINMAFFDGNLRTLKMAAEDSLELVATAVRRLTREPAKLFALDCGTLETGKQADVILVDPQALKSYDSAANTTMIHRDCFGHPQMVNRSDKVVTHTIIGGKVAWRGDSFDEQFGKQAYGRALRFHEAALAM